MIIVILGQPQPDNPTQMALAMQMEGIDNANAKLVLANMIAMIEQQEAAQNNGNVARPSGLIIPPTVVPRNPKRGDETS
jgi:hypothetical protein